MTYALILFILLSISLLFYKSIYVGVIDILGLVWICYTTPFLIDNIGYAENYSLVSRNKYLAQQITSFGWVKLSEVGLNLDLDYQQFKSIILILSLILILISIRRFVGTNYGLFFALYLIYPALVDIVQIRYFLAMSIIILGLSFLQHNKIRSYIVYLICLILAILIHNSCIIYVMFLALPFLNNKHIRGIIIRSIIILDILLIIFQNQLTPLFRSFATEKQQAYFVSMTLPNMLLFSLIIIMIAFISIQLQNMVKNEDNLITIDDKRKIAFLSDVNIMMLLIIPFLSLTYNFYRLERISWMILYMAFCLLIKYQFNWQIKRYRINLFVSSIIFALFGFLIMFLHFEPLIIETYPFFN